MILVTETYDRDNVIIVRCAGNISFMAVAQSRNPRPSALKCPGHNCVPVKNGRKYGQAALGEKGFE